MQNELASQNDDVFHILSNLKIADAIPVGMVGKMYSALDNMRSARAPSQKIAVAENISVAIRRLEMARRQRDGAAEQSVSERLNVLATNWMEVHPVTFSEVTNEAD